MLRFSLLLQPSISNLPELPCTVVLSLQRSSRLELWLSCLDAIRLAQALLALSDAGCAVVAAGLLSGKVVSPLILLSKPRLAEADPLVSGAIAIECTNNCVGKLREVLPRCVEVRWGAREPNKLRLKATKIHVSEIFDRQLRLVEPFRAPP